MADCIFCRIIAGELPSDTVASDERHVAFRDVDPKAETHVLVCPREHHEHLDAFLEAGADGAALLQFARSVADEVGVAGRYRLIANVGPDAGQEVPHLHLHVMAGRNLPGF